nr:MAG TPA: hypothetical protein [Caudoviricetes sp.]
MVASEPVAAGVAWSEACWVELKFLVFGNRVEVVKIV